MSHMKLHEISSIKVYTQEKFGRDNPIIEVLSERVSERATVVVKLPNRDITFEDCEVDFYKPCWLVSDEDEGVYAVRKDGVDLLEPKPLETKEPNKMIYVGFSQHDDESWYKCPVCNQPYGSWGFINGSVKVSDDGTFKCKCGTILVKPK